MQMRTRHFATLVTVVLLLGLFIGFVEDRSMARAVDMALKAMLAIPIAFVVVWLVRKLKF